MDYIGTIFVAVTNIVIGYVWGRLHEKNKEKEIRTLAGRLAEAVLFEWDNVVEIAKQTATAIEEWRWGTKVTSFYDKRCVHLQGIWR